MSALLLLLAALWSWDVPPCGDLPVAYRTESQRIYPVAYLPGMDDEGNLVGMPLYNVWAPAFISEGPEMQAEDGCEPAAGECCVMIVSSVDEAGNFDLGQLCP